MQGEGASIASFFDDDDLKNGFDFVKLDQISNKSLSAPASLKAAFNLQSANANQEGFFGLNDRFIIRYQDNTFKVQQNVLDLSNSKLKPLAPTDNEGKFGFAISRNGVTFNFTSVEEQIVQDWTDALRPICIQANFHEEYRALKMIGKGSFAKVYLVEAKTTGKSYAVKAFTKESIILSSKNNAKTSIINEIEIMRSLDHDHTIKLYEVYETEKSIYLVLDLIQGKSLQDILRKSSFKQEASGIKIFNIIRSILDALAYLASKRVMHRDLKPDNILLDKNDKVKIVDFGLATNIDVSEYIFKKCGTPGYIAPEVFKFDQKNKATAYDDRCDVFSAGCILFYLLFGSPFFDGPDVSTILSGNRKIATNPEAFAKIKQERSNPKSKIPKEGLDLLMQLLELEPKKRISAAEALDHPFFTPIPINMHKVKNSNAFYVDALSKYNQNRPSSPSRSPVKEYSDSSKQTYSMMSASPDKSAGSPVNHHNRFTERDSMYLDMGRPELNGKVDTLTSGSNNSLLLLNRLDSTGANGGSVSSFAKNKVLQDQKNRRQSKSFKNHNGLGGSQSFLKAAIFRNMQKNNGEITPNEDPKRRGSIEVNLLANGLGLSERRASTFQPGAGREEGETPSQFNEDGSEESPTSRFAQMPHKRFQPFNQKNI